MFCNGLIFSGNGPAKVLVHLSENGPCADLPKDYLLQFVKRPQQQQIHMFCESPAGGIHSLSNIFKY